MQKLLLPPAPLKVQRLESATYVWDVIRQKNILLTPEEWVRQHMIFFLSEHLGYPISLMKIEKQEKSRETGLRRCDIIVLDRTGSPELLVECKAPEIPLGPAIVSQTAVYQKIVNSPKILLTNGMDLWAFEVEREGEWKQVGVMDWKK